MHEGQVISTPWGRILLEIVFRIFDFECPSQGRIPDSSLLLHDHSLFMKFVQLTVDGAEFGTEGPPVGAKFFLKLYFGFLTASAPLAVLYLTILLLEFLLLHPLFLKFVQLTIDGS